MPETGPPITTRAMNAADLPAVVALLERTLGPAPGGVSRGDLFAWKHLRGPFGASIAQVAEMDGALIGLRSFMRWELMAAGERVLAVRAVDTATAPDVQRRGVFSRLTTEALETARAEGVRLVFNTPNDKSRPGYVKMGWTVLGSWPIRVKVRRPQRLALAVLRRDLRSGAGVDPPAGSALIRASEPRALEAFAMTADLKGPRGFHTVRSGDYLRWRYAEGPIGYHVLTEGGALIVLRLRARGRLREAVVCEALAAPGAMTTLAKMLARVPREAGADHAVAHIGAGWPAAGLLGRAGYRRIPRVGMTFAVRPVVMQGVPDPLALSSWSLTLGDLEVF